MKLDKLQHMMLEQKRLGCKGGYEGTGKEVRGKPRKYNAMTIEQFKKGDTTILSYGTEDQVKRGLKMAFGFHTWMPSSTWQRLFK